jgi:hypothetical protein
MTDLYVETKYLIEEIEGFLKKEKEQFEINKYGGRQITCTGTKSFNNVNDWLLKRYFVFFSPQGKVNDKDRTPVNNLRMIFINFNLHDDLKYNCPEIIFGYTEKHEGAELFEHFMRFFYDRWTDIFKEPELIDFNHSGKKMRGKYQTVKLFDIKSTDDVKKKIVIPVLKMYRE